MKRKIALGFYSQLSTAEAVIDELKKHGFVWFASIHRHHDLHLEIRRNFPFLVSKNLINRLKELVVIDEILVIVCIQSANVRDAVGILRQVKSGHPTTFLMRQGLLKEDDLEIPQEPLTIEAIETKSKALAQELKDISSEKKGRSLIDRLPKSNEMLLFLTRDIAEAEFIEQNILSSAEWLLDNLYVLEGSIDDVKLNLPKKYYRELPKIREGPLAGYPRIYALAVELIKSTVARAGKNTQFKCYQHFTNTIIYIRVSS